MENVYKDDADALAAGQMPTDPDEGCPPVNGVAHLWPDPTLPFERPPLPSFPVHLLSDWQREFVEAVAVELEVDPAMAAMSVLTAEAAVCGRRMWLETREGWIVPANLWTLTLQVSGQRKTGVFRRARAPLSAAEGRMQTELGPTIAKQQAERRVLVQRLREAEREACKEKDADLRRALTNDVGELAAELERFQVAHKPILYTADATTERIEQMLMEQDGRAAVLADEVAMLGTLARRAGDTRSAPNLSALNNAYDGEDVRIARMAKADGSSGDRTVTKAVLTLGFMPQPDVAIPLLRSATAFADSGFLWRFLICHPRSTVGERTHDTAAVPLGTLARYGDRMGELLALPIPSTENIPTVRASRAAADALIAFQRALEPRLKPDADLAGLGSWASKLAGQVVRLAGLLHAAEHRSAPWKVPVSLATMQRAIELAEYFIPHAQAAALEMRADPIVKMAGKIVDWIRRTRQRKFSKTDLSKALANNGAEGTAKVTADALSRLVEGRVLTSEKAPTAGRPVVVYTVNPKIHEPKYREGGNDGR